MFRLVLLTDIPPQMNISGTFQQSGGLVCPSRVQSVPIMPEHGGVWGRAVFPRERQCAEQGQASLWFSKPWSPVRYTYVPKFPYCLPLTKEKTLPQLDIGLLAVRAHRNRIVKRQNPCQLFKAPRLLLLRNEFQCMRENKQRSQPPPDIT